MAKMRQMTKSVKTAVCALKHEALQKRAKRAEEELQLRKKSAAPAEVENAVLRHRVQELEVENAALRAELAEARRDRHI
jgi:hypothetical protein